MTRKGYCGCMPRNSRHHDIDVFKRKNTMTRPNNHRLEEGERGAANMYKPKYTTWAGHRAQRKYKGCNNSDRILWENGQDNGGRNHTIRVNFSSKWAFQP